MKNTILYSIKIHISQSQICLLHFHPLEYMRICTVLLFIVSLPIQGSGKSHCDNIFFFRENYVCKVNKTLNLSEELSLVHDAVPLLHETRKRRLVCIEMLLWILIGTFQFDPKTFYCIQSSVPKLDGKLQVNK